MKRNYRFDPAPYNTHQLLLGEVPAGSMVLEVGTASGYLGEYLIHEKGCTVWGIEPVKELYQDAFAVGYTKLINKSAEAVLLENDLAGQQFDCVLLGDVLEHMADPGGVLRGLKKYLKPGAVLIVSLPNITHYSIRWNLLFGRFERTDAGILDRTHLQFFTRESARALLADNGYKVEMVRPSGGYLERFGKRKLFGVGSKLLFLFPRLFSEQFIFRVRN